MTLKKISLKIMHYRESELVSEALVVCHLAHFFSLFLRFNFNHSLHSQPAYKMAFWNAHENKPVLFTDPILVRYPIKAVGKSFLQY